MFFSLYFRNIISAIAALLLSLSLLAGNTGVSNTEKGIELRNDFVSILISKNAELLSCKDLKSGVEIAINNHKKVAYLNTYNGTTIEANKATLNGSILCLFIGQSVINLELHAYDHFFTVEVINKELQNVESLTFLDLRMRYDFAIPDVFIAAGVAMNIQTNPVYYPSGESKAVIGRCSSLTGITGAKLAIVACHKNRLRDVLKEIYSRVPFGDIPLSTSGGAYALDSEMVRKDCVNTHDADSAQLPSYIDVLTRYGIGQVDFILGPNTFVQGQFSFPAFGSAAKFKEKITAPLLEKGIVSSMHTFSFYISYGAKELLANPRWQQQLEFWESYTLSKKMTSTDKTISLSKGSELYGLMKDPSFGNQRSPYLLIDEEIVSFTNGEDGLIHIGRGQCGTTAKAHPLGTKVRIIGGYYSHIAPRPGSELFYEIAHRTADAYNEGGFKGIYFDAFEGLRFHLEHAGLRDYLWYYGASFVNEVLRYCNEPPMVEYSTLYPTIWSARGRGGALDTPLRGYRAYINDHIHSNTILKDRLFVTTLGWFNLYPLQRSEPWGYSTKYIFFDDVDYLGVMSIAYDQTMVYNNLSVSSIESIPAMQRNLNQFSLYSKLRTEKYFTDDVLDVIKGGKYEYKLVKKGLKWGLKEAAYCRSKIRDIEVDRLNGVNPFKKQKPFIRIQNLYTSNCESRIRLMTYDDSKNFIDQINKKSFATPLNLSNHLGIKVKVKGNGIKSTDAICIRLTSMNGTAVADFVIRLGFDDWKDIILTDLDNGDYGELFFKGMDNNIHNAHRFNLDYTKVSSISLYKYGECKDVKIGTIEAVPLASNPLANPSIQLGQSTISFLDTIQSGEYLEYTVGDRKAFIYDCIGNSREVSLSRKGRFRVPHGTFTATVSGESEIKNAPTEVVLTIGLYGNVIKN